MKGIEKAVLKVGGQTELARRIGVSQARVWNWINRDRDVPAEMVLRIEKASGVPRQRIRPDIYP